MRNDSKSITLPFYITNNLLLVASLIVARGVCKAGLGVDAELATLQNPRLAKLAKEVVDETKKPHWISGFETAGVPIIDWGSGIADGWKGAPYPWDTASGQPNDCDGPGTEPCIFVGPGGNWFDFAWQTKVDEGTTPGPEITWDGNRAMYNIHPLCVVESNGTIAMREEL